MGKFFPETRQGGRSRDDLEFPEADAENVTGSVGGTTAGTDTSIERLGEQYAGIVGVQDIGPLTLRQLAWRGSEGNEPKKQ